MPTTTAPRTEPEKEGSVNRSVTSSPPPLPDMPTDPCSPVHIEPHPSTPSLTLTPPSYLVIIYLQGAKKRRDAETPAELQNVQNLLLNPPPSLLFHIFKTTEYDAKTNDQIENGVGELLMTVNP